MAGTINPANVVVGYDGTKIKTGIDGTRADLNKLKQNLEASIDPMVKLNRQVDVLKNAFAKGAISAEQYNRTLKHLHSQMDLSGGTVAKFAKSALAVGAAYLSIRTAVGAARMAVTEFFESAERIDKVNDAAKKLAISYGDLVVLRNSLAETSGMDVSDIDGALSKMQLNLAKARDDGGKLADHLKALGLDAGELLKQGPVAAMATLSDRIRGMKDPADQLRVSFELFGKGGVGLVTSLRDGAAAINDMNKFTEEWGGKLTTIQTEQIDGMNDAFGRLKIAVEGVTGQVVSEFAPAFTVVAQNMLGIAEPLKDVKDVMPEIVKESLRWAGLMIDIGKTISLIDRVIRAGTGKLNPTSMALNFAADTALDAGLLKNLSTGEQLVKQYDEVREAARKAAEERENRPKEFGGELHDESDEIAEVAKEAKKLDDERLKAMKLRLDMQRKAIDEEFDKQRRLVKERNDAIAKMADHFATPAERLTKELLRIDELQRQGLSKELADRARAEAITRRQEDVKDLEDKYATPREKLEEEFRKIQKIQDEAPGGSEERSKLEEEIAQIEAQIEEINALKDAAEYWGDEWHGLAGEFQTQNSLLNRKIEELEGMAAQDTSIFDKARNEAAKNFQDERDNGVAQTIAPAIKAGSAEAYKFLIGRKEESTKLLERQLIIQKEQKDLEKETLTAIRALSPVRAIR